MKNVLVAVNNEGFPNEFAGIGSIAAYLESKGVLVDIKQIDVAPDCRVSDLVEEFSLEYDLFGFYIIYTNAELVTGIIKWIKKNKHNCHIFVGGHCATVAADEILQDCKEIDYVVLGDGEIPVFNMIEALEGGKKVSDLPSIRTREDVLDKKPCIVDIATIPWIKRYYYKKNKSNIYANARLVSSKRCLGKCSFCSTIHSSERQGKWECRDIDDVYKEIIYLYENYGIRYFSFIDPSFEDPGQLGKKRIKYLCTLLKQYPVKFFFWCYLRAETFSEEDEELIKLMREAGFAKIFIGIESFNQEDLDLFEKRATIEDNYRSLSLFKKYDFDIWPGIIMINPLSTKERLTNNFNHMIENRINMVYLYVTVIELFYKTPLYNKIKELNLVLDTHSYKNPFGYKILDDYVQVVFDYIVNVINYSKILKKENNFRYTYSFIITSVRELFPEEYHKVEFELNNILDKVFEEIKRYFSILYVDYDIEKAKSEFGGFEEKVCTLYDKAHLIMMKLLKNKSIREYLR